MTNNTREPRPEPVDLTQFEDYDIRVFWPDEECIPQIVFGDDTTGAVSPEEVIDNLISDLRATREERDTEHHRIRAEVERLRDEAERKSIAAHAEDPNSGLDSYYMTQANTCKRVLALLDGEEPK